MAMPDPLPSRANGMNVCLEVFLVNLAGENAVRYIVFRQDITGDGRNPDELVMDITNSVWKGRMAISREHCFIHSTSWRYERYRTIVLTYLVYSDLFKFRDAAVTVLDLQNVTIPASESAIRPRPPEIAEEHIVIHGMRHLSHLVKSGHPSMQGAIKPASARCFLAMEGVLAGKFHARSGKQ